MKRLSSTGLSNFRLSIGMRIFIMSALLIAISLTIVVGFTYRVSQSVADETLRESLDHSLTLQNKFRELNERDLVTVIQGFASDPNFSAYILDATSRDFEDEVAIDVDSIADLLQERRNQLTLDFIIALDVEGKAIVHSERDGWQHRELADHPLVQPVYEDLYPNSGIWLEGDLMYQAAVAPLTLDYDVIGFIIAGVAINDSFATGIKQISGSDIAYLIASDNGYRTAASTLSLTATDELVRELRDNSPVPMTQLTSEVQVPVTLSDDNHVVQVQPLSDNVQAMAHPMLLTVSSPSRYTESFESIITVVIVAGIVSTLLAMVLSYLFSSRTLRPVTRLATAAEAAAQGNYSKPINVGGKDELTRLGSSINHLLSDLREKQDMQNYLTQISHLIPDGERTTQSPGLTRQPPKVETTTLLAMDLTPVLEQLSKASQIQSNLQTLSQTVEETAHNMGGEIHSETANHIICAFYGSKSPLAAYATVVDINRACRRLASQVDGRAPRFALASGRCLSGSLAKLSGMAHYVFGGPLKQVSRLLMDARPGECLTTNSFYQSLRDVFTRVGVKPQMAEGKYTGKMLCALPPDAEQVLRLPQLAADKTDTIHSSRGGTDRASLRTGSFIVGRYEVLAQLGEGSMGSVFKAMDRELDSLVAIKVLRTDQHVDKAAFEQMKSEIKLARQITHQNILRTYDLGEVSGVPFITMEYVRGLTLRKLIGNTGKLPYSAGLRVARQLCEGLIAVHAIGVLHRDIKPENIIIEMNGNVKLMDFGIARSLNEFKRSRDKENNLFMGTPRYASPEQMLGKALDNRSDIYSCGVVLTEVFTGEIPIDGQTFTQISSAHISTPPIAPSTLWAGIPRELETILLKCLAKKPEERYDSVEELLKALNNVQA